MPRSAVVDQHGVLYTALKGPKPPLHQAPSLSYTKLLDINNEASTTTIRPGGESPGYRGHTCTAAPPGGEGGWGRTLEERDLVLVRC